MMFRRWVPQRVKEYVGALTDVIFPRTCEVCGRTLVGGEKVICLDCLMGMPRTQFHLGNASPVLKLTAEAKIVRMASMFFYSRTSGYAEMLKKSKYHNHPEIDRQLALIFSNELSASGFFSGIDAIMPVPMYRWKRWLRGFNQSEEIAYGVEEATGIPVIHNLQAARHHSTQTRKSAVERRSLSSDIFILRNPAELKGRHVLLVDDIITTGGTVVACINAIRDAEPSVRISLLSLAHTSYA